jgi:hypothetical protein
MKKYINPFLNFLETVVLVTAIISVLILGDLLLKDRWEKSIKPFQFTPYETLPNTEYFTEYYIQRAEYDKQISFSYKKVLISILNKEAD